MSNINHERELGGVQEKLKRLETEVSEMRADVREIRDVVVSVKGGWRTLAVIAAISSVVGGANVKISAWFFYLPR